MAKKSRKGSEETDGQCPVPAELVTRSALARLLGCSVRQVSQLESEGVIVAQLRGKAGRASLYAPDVVVPAYMAYNSGKNDGDPAEALRARTRKDRAQAVLAEQTFQLRAKELLPRADVEKAWGAEVSAVRTKLLSWPTTIADRVFRAGTLNGIAGVERVLREAAHDVLRELSDTERIDGQAAEPEDIAEDAE